MSNFNGNLIDGRSAYTWIINNVSNVPDESSIGSAFLRSSIIKDLGPRFPLNSSVRVLVRWQLGDLVAGASDLEAYEACRKLGWKFYICLNFHGKVCYLPTRGIMLGSANATDSGFGLSDHSNSEVCTVVSENSFNIKFINDLYDKAILMNDELYEKMKEIYELTLKNAEILEWPKTITKELNRHENFDFKLLLSDLFKTNGEELFSISSSLSSDAKSDLSLLGLRSENFNSVSIAQHFKQTKIYFLLTKLINEKDGEVYFGELSTALHDWLADDPVQQRRDVKALVKNLFSWISFLESYDVGLAVDRPNHSERIRLRRDVEN